MDVAYFFDDLNLAVETSSTTFNERDVGSQTHSVDVSSRIEVVQRIEDNLKSLEPRNVESWIFDVVVVCLNLDVGVELARRLFRHLLRSQRMPMYLDRSLPTYQSF